MTIIYLIIVAYKGGGIDYISLFSILLLLFELAIFAALTILFSTFTTPLASTLYSIVILYIGHSLSILLKAGLKSGNLIEKWLVYFVYYVFPNLEKFNLRNQIVYGILPNAGQIIYPVIYSICLTATLLWLTVIALKKQDL
jgi:Cu-processing system permease protein